MTAPEEYMGTASQQILAGSEGPADWGKLSLSFRQYASLPVLA